MTHDEIPEIIIGDKNHQYIRVLLDELKITQLRDYELTFVVDKLFTGNTMYDFVSPRNTNVVHVMLSESVRLMKSGIIHQIEASLGDKLSEIKDELKEVKAYRVNVIMCNKWLTKGKKLRKIDLTNIWKPIEDAVMESLGLDDSLCVEETLIKKQAEVDDSDQGKFIVKFKFYR